MTEKKKRFLSLSVKPLFVLLLGLVLGVGAALLAESVGEAVIERCYLSEAAVLKRTNRAAQELQGYVRQNALTTRNTNALAQWGESRKDYYILLYRDQRQILEIGWWGADIAAVDAYSLKEQGAEVVYPIAFRDGTVYAVIYDNSDSRLYDVTWVVSLLLGCAVLALTLLVLGGCTVRDMVQVVGVSTTTLQELADAALSDETEAPESGDQFVTAESPEETPAEAPQDEAAPADEVSETTDTVGEHTYYYDVDHVVLYLDTYGHLPENYITKDEARALGWEGGSVEVYQEGAAIGGDRFGNREGLLPEQTGRSYTECDINTDGADSRGAERLIFSNDGLYFYTSDHYASFTELTVDGGTVVWSR